MTYDSPCPRCDNDAFDEASGVCDECGYDESVDCCPLCGDQHCLCDSEHAHTAGTTNSPGS